MKVFGATAKWNAGAHGAGAGVASGQCSLRAAVQGSNALNGDDTITFNIPTTQPNCNAGTGKRDIQLTKVLPDLSTNVAIVGPGAGKLTVRRLTGDAGRAR